MTQDVGVFCKTYRKDFDHLALMLSSFHRHNPEGLRLTLSLPSQDMSCFRERFGTNLPDVQIIEDESYCSHNLNEFRGWHSQQICKLMSWNAMTEKQYLCVDSDCYFIRDLRPSELRASDGKRHIIYASFLRTVLIEGREELPRYIRGELEITEKFFPHRRPASPCRINEFVKFRDLDPDSPGALERSDIPMRVFGGDKWVFFQPGQTYARFALKHLFDFLTEKKLSIGDLIRISPWENNWYGEFVISQLYDEMEFRISPFFHIQSKKNLDFARRQGLSTNILSSKFLLINMAAGHLSELSL